MSTIKVDAPDGTTIEFPEGTTDDVIIEVMKREYPPSTPEAPTDYSRLSGAFVQGALPYAASGLAGGLASGPFWPVGALAGTVAPLVADAGVSAYNALAPEKYELGLPSRAIHSQLQKLPFYDAPETTGERAALAAGEAVGSVVPQVTAAKALASTAKNPILAGVAETLARAPKTQAAIAPTSAVAGQVVGETTGNPLLGLAASLGTGTGIGFMSRPPKPPKRTSGDLRNEANKIHAKAEEIGLTVKDDSISNLRRKIASVLKDAGYSPEVHPELKSVIKHIENETKNLRNSGIPLKEVEILRRIVKSRGGSADPDVRRLSVIALDVFDEVVGSWNSRDTVSGSTDALKLLKQFRKVYYDKSRLDTIESLMNRIDLKQSQFSASGRENAIRNEFRTLANNERRMRLFPKNEQEMIRKVAKGGALRNTLRYFGKFAPTGPVSGFTHGGGFGLGMAAGMDPLTAGLLTAGGAGLTGGARLGAGRIAQGQVDNLIEQITRGGPGARIDRPRATVPGLVRGLLSN
jgi:hypothetical protein